MPMFVGKRLKWAPVVTLTGSPCTMTLRNFAFVAYWGADSIKIISLVSRKFV